MENATKALYMAAGVFIGILILTVLVMLFSQGRIYLSSANDQDLTRQAEQFNSQFAVYIKKANPSGTDEDYEEGNSIYDVISACNLACSINKQLDYNQTEGITIIIKDTETDVIELQNTQESSGKKLFTNSKPINYLITEVVKDKILNEMVKFDSFNTQKFKYQFEGKAEYNNVTKRINKLIFTLKS